MKMQTAVPEVESLAFMGASFTDKQKVCFVCTGNTCRSPMAEAVLNGLDKNRHWLALSAGLYPQVGTPIAVYAVEALHHAGIEPIKEDNYEQHTAIAITQEMAEACDQIIGMTQQHTFLILQAFPQYASKIFAMPIDISDPYGGSLEDYRNCLAEIQKGIHSLFLIEKDT